MGKILFPKVIGTVICYCTDEKGQLYTRKLNNVIYFTDSSFNIISETVLYEYIKYDEGTWVLKIKSILTWDFGKYKKTIAHSLTFLP